MTKNIRSIAGFVAVMVLGASMGWAEGETAERKGPLKDLPSEPKGEHLEKIKALGDNEWVELGQPEADPKWGTACGRSWAPLMPYAPEMRGAFLTGEGPHGHIKSDGYGMDDVWFYDANQHRWICVYPGTPARGGYDEVISIDPETGFEVDKDGNPVPVAVGVHAYMQVTYDTDRKLLMRTTCGSYLGAKIKGRKEAQEAYKEAKKKKEAEESDADKEAKAKKNFTTPWIYNTVEDRWEIYRVEKPHSRFKVAGFGATLVYVPSVKKAFGFRKRSYPFGWYDPEKREWSTIGRKGKSPPWDMDSNVCYDSKRDCLYMGGGIFPVIKEGSALYKFDVQTETFDHLQPEGRPTAQSYSSNRAMFLYDSVNDAAVLFHHSVKKKRGEVAGIYAYHPEENKWVTVSEEPEAMTRKRPNAYWNGFYDPELNVFFLHVGTDGRANGSMWAYRYKGK